MQSTQIIKPEKVWDIIQAQKWEKIGYREEYLNHEFQILEEETETSERGFDEQEIAEEELVQTTSYGIADKGKDCESVNAEHSWYNINGKSSGCYYCKVSAKDQNWKS